MPRCRLKLTFRGPLSAKLQDTSLTDESFLS
jgi:hypothetical protein